MLFFKGVLLKDPDGILIKTGENTRVSRQIRFNNVEEIINLAPVLKTYILQAIEVEKAGLKVPDSEYSEPELPEELLKKFEEMPLLKDAFKALTPGRQRAYSYYFSQAKQSKTKEARIEKCIPQILEGKGYNEQ